MLSGSVTLFRDVGSGMVGISFSSETATGEPHTPHDPLVQVVLSNKATENRRVGNNGLSSQGVVTPEFDSAQGGRYHDQSPPYVVIPVSLFDQALGSPAIAE
jgi:hypothetical protein